MQPGIQHSCRLYVAQEASLRMKRDKIAKSLTGRLTNSTLKQSLWICPPAPPNGGLSCYVTVFCLWKVCALKHMLPFAGI